MKIKSKDTGKTLQRHEPGLLDEMDRAFDTMLSRGLMNPNWLRPFRDLWPDWTALQTEAEVRLPRVDLVDHETELLVRAELPGIDKKDLHIDLSGDMLTIRGERRHEEKTEEENYYHAEIARGSFCRTMRLPVEVAGDKVEATFDKGLLEIRLPKRETTPRQKIEVK
ncbi:Hsp20/alpha crystallin family protein [Thiohalocapsa marina]|uniref:Hsp20/alpha crystallin family protein n=1 Tax=Thiohalocapsa marina TaxID=424902 RepID=A0A5M8FQ94_9GAMM|nr:Hsp20/alpha crystallin family protein [Thiohalocapsa marina]KAA6184635.1 Hsp20/alpha crystallin family protein [Thiohalocapsa marina]